MIGSLLPIWDLTELGFTIRLHLGGSYWAMNRLYPKCAWLCCLLGLTGVAQASDAAIDLTGAPETVFAWHKDRCAKEHIPDAPARAFRDKNGAVHLFAAHYHNRAMVGPGLSGVRVNCASRFRGNRSSDPLALDDLIWLTSFHTADGNRVIALGHAEFHGYKHPALCPVAQYAACWRNGIIAASSDDGGRSFSRTPGRSAAVAALPYPYDGHVGRRTGYFNPSNIIRWKGKLYAFVFAEKYRAQRRGPCLLRSDPAAKNPVWRGWDGRGFSADLGEFPMVSRPPANKFCIPVPGIRWTMTSLVRHQPSGRFIALFSGWLKVSPTGPVGVGFYYVSSRDLIRWSKPKLLLKRPLMFMFTCGEKEVFAYPSLLDETSPSRNFDTVSNNAFLYVTRFNMSGCRLPMNRDLIRMPVRIRVDG